MTEDGVRLRMAQPRDLSALAAIFQAGGRPLLGASAEAFAPEADGEEVIVAADVADGPLGFASLYRPHRFLHHLYVAPGAQGRGVGSALLAGAAALAGGELELKCLSDAAGALSFYAARGFGPTGETGVDAAGPWVRLRGLQSARGRLALSQTPLAGPHCRLEPLVERHREALRPHAVDPALWSFWPRDMSDWDRAFDHLRGEAAAGRWHVYTVLNPEGAPIGQTCHLAITPEHARVEIGGTWYAASAQGTLVNPMAKLLMLGHAFARGAQRVELKTDSMNARSRAAISKLGAQFEGVHRRHMRRPDGTWRDTAWYAILPEDWPRVRAALEARLGLA